MEYHPVSRRVERSPVTMGANCRTHSGLRGSGRIFNLSSLGCCLDSNGLYIAIGSRVVLQLDGMEGISGVVRWSQGTRMGVEFDQPLYEPLAAHLVKKFASDNSVVWNTAPR